MTTDNNFFDCSTNNVNKSVVAYFCNALGRINGYNNFNIKVDPRSVTAWDGYDSVTIAKSSLPNKIARKLYL